MTTKHHHCSIRIHGAYGTPNGRKHKATLDRLCMTYLSPDGELNSTQ
ncbi:MAG: hypothetical protein ACREPR_01600 [Brasilonema sp.]